MNVLDWVLLVVVAAYALSGYWQGFVTGAFATAGLLLGGLFGIWLAPVALGNANPSLLVSLGALFIVILAASLGQALFQYVGAKIRDRVTWQPARALDAVGGAVLLVIVSNILDAVTALGDWRQVLPTHYQYAWTDLLGPTLVWDEVARGVLWSLAYSLVLYAVAWWHFLRKDVVS